jgi:transmembrane sensor
MDERDLLRLIEGECSPEEAAAIQSWVAADPRRGELLDELRTVWRLTGGGARRWDIAAARRRLLRARNAAPNRTQPVAPSSSGARHALYPAVRWTRRFATAACVVAIAVVVDKSLSPTESSSEREYTTALGERATITLDDGTRVQLSVGTTLRVLRGSGGRSVELDGEAYFIVRHRPASPFIVRTARGTARDLGTEFSVRDYRNEAYLQVVVATDSVELFNNAPNDSGATLLTLRPRDRALIDQQGRVTVTSGVALDQYIAWTRGRLLFDDDSLATVLRELERWYDLRIGVGDPSLAAERITISFETESADEALSALAKVLAVRMTRDGRVVRLAPDGPVTPQQR